MVEPHLPWRSLNDNVGVVGHSIVVREKSHHVVSECLVTCAGRSESVKIDSPIGNPEGTPDIDGSKGG